MRWAAAIAAVLTLSGCDFGGLFEKYCLESGNCRCEGPDCCAEEGQSCADLPCCDGMSCSGTCQGEVQLVFDPPAPVLTVDGVAPPTSATQQIRVTNQGQRLTHNFRVLPGAPTNEFTFETSGCDGRELGSGQSCTFSATFAPSALGQRVAPVKASSQTHDFTVDVVGRAGRELSVNYTPTWHASLVSSPPGLDCPDNTCSAFFPRGTTATLQLADPDAGVQAQLGPPCTQGVPCVVTMNQDVTVSAQFAPFLTIDFPGLYGYVHLEPTGDVASYYGQRQFALRGPTRLVLEGTAVVPWTDGPCAGQEPTCLLDIQSPLTVKVDFSDRLSSIDIVGPYPLTEIGANIDFLCGNEMAWVFTSTRDPRRTLSASRGWGQGGQPFLDRISDAEVGRALARLQLFGPVGPVISGLRPDGGLPAPGDVCDDFTSTAGTTVPGTPGLGGSAWFYDPAAGPLPCSGEAYLVCFSPGPPVRPIAPYGPRRLAFVSRPWVPLGGVSAADTFCQSEASGAGSTRTFRALLNRTGETPGERFARPQGSPWSTPAGNAVPLPGYPASFPEGPYVNIGADGSVIRSTGAVDTGTLLWSDQFSTDDADNCASWTGGTGTGRVRRPEEPVPTIVRVSCATAQRLLCFED